MVQLVTGPDGTQHEFPDEATPDMMSQALGLGAPAPAKADPLLDAIKADQAKFGTTGDKLQRVQNGLVQGAADVVNGGAQLLARGLEAVAPTSIFGDFFTRQRQATEAANAQNEKDYQATKTLPGQQGFDGPHLVGGGLAMGPLGRVIAPGTITGAAASGAVGGALQPVDTTASPNYWLEKAKQVGEGAAFGAAIQGGANAAARVIRPNTSPDVQTLIDAGVTPTPGQVLGGGFRATEEKLKSVPGVGDAIKNAEVRANQDFNRVAINKVLAPIGESLDPKTPIGREAIDEAITKVSDAYSKLVPNLTARVDAPFVQELTQLNSLAKFLPNEGGKEFESIVKRELLSKINPQTQVITGESLKEAEEALGKEAAGYTGSSVNAERKLGAALREAQATLRRLVERTNPDLAPQLQANNAAYAMLLRVQNAAGRIGSANGEMTPATLLQAIRQMDGSLNKRQFARGDALLQDYAESAKNVLGNKVPDSGTAGRNAVIGAMVGAPAAIYANPLLGGLGVGAAGLGMLPYTPLGQRLAVSALTARPPGADALAQSVRQAGTTGAAVAPFALRGLLGP